MADGVVEPPAGAQTRPKKKKAKKGGRTDEELFGNTDDIFGEIPDSVATKKPKKKKAAATKTEEGTTATGESAAWSWGGR